MMRHRVRRGRHRTLRSGAHLGVITDLFVEPGAAVGIGECMALQLIACCKNTAARNRCTGAPRPSGAKNFERNGFTARATMHRRLDP
jgi:hypothetical protein